LGIISSVQTQLSVGQRQRISLARVILRNPTILILDEVTSSLDYLNDKKVKEALKQIMQNRTCIIVSHDLSFHELSDRYFKISNGSINELNSLEIKSLLNERESFYAEV